MKSIIGFILLALVFAFLIGITCHECGWKFGLKVWGIGFALALIIVFAMYLIEGGK